MRLHALVRRQTLKSEHAASTCPFRTVSAQLRGLRSLRIQASRCGQRFNVVPFGKLRRMIILGLVLLLIGLLIGSGLLWSVGIVLLLVGVVLMVLGRSGHKIGGRAHYF